MFGFGGKPNAAPDVDFGSAIPVMQVFDFERARAFYIDYLGFDVEWAHRYDPEAPLYVQIARGAMRLHLTEELGQSASGASACVPVTQLSRLHNELKKKNTPFDTPDLEEIEGGGRALVLTDPFGNRLRLHEGAVE